MKKITCLLLLFLFCRCNDRTQIQETENKSSRTCDEEQKDPFRYLENLKDEEVLKWYMDQGVKAKEILNNLSGRQDYIDRQVAMFTRQKENISLIELSESGRYFYLKQTDIHSPKKLYYRDGINKKETLLYNPANFKPEDGGEYVINYIKPNMDGSKVVISLSKSGAEISEMIIINVTTQRIYPEIIDHCWPSDGGGVSWLYDGSGFIYLHYPVIDINSDQFLKNMKSVYHRIGTDPKKLNEIFSKSKNSEIDIKEEDFPMVLLEKRTGKYMIGELAGAEMYTKGFYAKSNELSEEKVNWIPLFSKDNKITKYWIKGDQLIYATAERKSNYEICQTSIIKPNFSSPTVLVPEFENEVIEDFVYTSHGLYFIASKYGLSSRLFRLKDGETTLIELPEPAGKIFLTSVNDQVYITISGWLSNNKRYIFNEEKEQFLTENLFIQAPYPEFENFIVEEIEVPSHDGEMVPLSIIRKSDIKMDKSNPVLFFGYGAYGFSAYPTFVENFLSWVDYGGILAVAHVRGGSEKGDDWHKGGYKTTKPNSWKDLIACTEYMIGKNYTSPKKTVIMGASAGGIMVGRAITERPDLFAVAISQVGVFNTSRMHLTPNGANSAKEFGSIDIPEECIALKEMDAYLNVKDGVKYPAVILTSALNDPRVVPWMSGKFAARLQQATSSSKPVLLLLNEEGGHGMDNSQMDKIEEFANLFSFALWQLGDKRFELNQ